MVLPLAAAASEPVTLHWLDGQPPEADAAVSWGVPWPKAALRKDATLVLSAANGSSLPMQWWPLAFWPDGSVKWSGHALAHTREAAGPLALRQGVDRMLRPNASAPTTRTLRVIDAADAITIDTGVYTARLPRRGADIVATLTLPDGRVIAERGQLVAQREERAELATQGLRREETFVSEVETVTVEQAGPLRAAIKVTGRHRSNAGTRTWLPFSLRLYFHADSAALRMTHSFTYDGNADHDFIRALGLTFEVPFRDEAHNRHIRLGTDDAGAWAQPVRMLPGFRPQAGPQAAALYGPHLDGQRVPAFEQLEKRTQDALHTMPVWGDAKLTQLSPNGWSLWKRTTAEASWLHVTDGRRANGLVLLGDTSGALAVGARDFWQRCPAALEVTGGGTPRGRLAVWFWSPDAPAMDLRRYSETPHGLAINYEDWKPGWGSPYGVAATHDLTLWVLDGIPGAERLAAIARAAKTPPLLVCAPQYYHQQRVFGHWSLPDHSTPAKRWIEHQVEGLVEFYRGQVDERSWYGFWDFGDIMHNYDFARQEWRYDIGGWAWANTELMPDLLLWYSFLRTGRADWYRFAEAMTRHTSEVDVHHLGPFAPLGSRHNVNHWGDGAKQPRASHAGLLRFYYFLSGGDGRVGDLLRDQVDADLAYTYLQQFNNSHYVPNPDGSPRLDVRTPPAFPNAPAVVPAPRPEEFGPRPTAAERKPNTRFGLEWMCYALNWTTEWERGVDPAWRARMESDMRAMAASVDQAGRFPGRYFDMIFGGPENMWEMEPMYDIPEFWRAWVETCEAVGRAVEGNHMTGPRLLAYASFKKRDPVLGRLAWEKLIGPPGKLPTLPQPRKVRDPLGRTVTEPAFLGGSVGWQLHGVASVQWALNAIQTLELAGDSLPAWENGQ